MKKFSVFPLIALCIAVPLTAQSYVYHDNSSPTGGNTSMNTFPFGNAFGNTWRYQLSVPAATMPGKPIRILEVAFAPTASGTFAVKDFQLRMGHSTSATLSSLFATNIGPSPTTLIDVQNGNYTFKATANQWTPLGVKNGFNYDGKQALVIEIRYRGHGTLNQGTTSIRSFTSATNANRLWAHRSTSPVPVDPYSATAGAASSTGAIRVRLTYTETMITLSGSTGAGGTVDLNLLSSGNATRPYQAASSLGTGPIPIDTRVLNLSPDGLMEVTIFGRLPSVFLNYSGKLDASGKAKARVKIPNIPALKGTRIHSAFVTLNPASPSGLSNISNTATFTIT